MSVKPQARLMTQVFSEKHRKSAESLEGTLRMMEAMEGFLSAHPEAQNQDPEAKAMSAGLVVLTAREAAFHREMVEAYDRLARGLPPLAVGDKAS